MQKVRQEPQSIESPLETCDTSGDDGGGHPDCADGWPAIRPELDGIETRRPDEAISNLSEARGEPKIAAAAGNAEHQAMVGSHK